MVNTINVHTNKRTEFIDLTQEINSILRTQEVLEGTCHLFCPHTTAALAINENCDPNVMGDIDAFLNKLVPNLKEFRHLEGNSDAHIKSCLIGVSQLIPISSRQLVLGTWQGVYFCEFDGPRDRKVFVNCFSSR